MRHTLRQKLRAESLIETLIAITVIVLASTTALTMIRTAAKGNEIIGEKIVALNLAIEGAEVLKNIRDTNYLLFASDADNCWNKYDVESVDDCSDGTASEITDGSTYRLKRNLNASDGPLWKWTLVEVSDTSTEGFLDKYEYEMDEDFEIDDDTDNEVVQIYAQANIPSASGFTVVEEDPFQRLIEIDYDGETDSYIGTVTVYWTDRGGEEKSVSLLQRVEHIY